MAVLQDQRGRYVWVVDAQDVVDAGRLVPSHARDTGSLGPHLAGRVDEGHEAPQPLRAGIMMQMDVHDGQPAHVLRAHQIHRALQRVVRAAREDLLRAFDRVIVPEMNKGQLRTDDRVTSLGLVRQRLADVVQHRGSLRRLHVRL